MEGVLRAILRNISKIETLIKFMETVAMWEMN
jgi:hypothetical protein